MLSRFSLIAQSLFYTASGLNHFWHPTFYRAVMPDHYSDPAALIQISGLAEIAGGLGLLLPVTRRFSAAGLALLLLVFLDVHVFMLRHPGRFPNIPVCALWARLPLQGLFLCWALQAYTHRHRPAVRRIA